MSAQPAGDEWFEVERLLFLARSHVGMDLAWVSRFADGEQVINATSGDAAAMNVQVGEGSSLSGSFCARVLSGEIAAFIPSARTHEVTRDLQVTHDLSIGSYVGAPWRGPDNEVMGMVCCLSRGPNPGLDDKSAAFLAFIADLISDILGSERAEDQRENRRDLAIIERVLVERTVRMVFQPVRRLGHGEPVAYEALARFEDYPTPVHAFAVASHLGLGVELELLALQEALTYAPAVPDGATLAVNLSAEALLVAEVQRTLLDSAEHDISVELTEHAPVSDYAALHDVTSLLRSHSIGILIDDAGAGYAGLQHILQVAPDVIKLDMTLVRDVDKDPVRAALARSLAAFAMDIDAGLIAEGIETREEHDTLVGLGVEFGQGFLLGRPASLPPVRVRAG